MFRRISATLIVIGVAFWISGGAMSAENGFKNEVVEGEAQAPPIVWCDFE